MSHAKTAEPIEMSLDLWIRMGSRKHVLDGEHTVAPGRIPFNGPCAAAMRPFCKITLTTCYFAALVKRVNGRPVELGFKKLGFYVF